jgi:hypothetical protein
MPENENRPLSLKRALGLSAGLHLLAAPLFIVLPGFVATAPSFEPREPAEIIHISSSHPAQSRTLSLARAVRQSAASASRPFSPRSVTAKAAVRVQAPLPHPPAVNAPVIARDPTAHHATTALFQHDAGRRPALVKQAALVVAEAGGSSGGTPAQNAAAAPAAEESQDQSSAAPPATSGRDYGIPAGGWGQNFDKPLVADDSALSDLHARFHGSATVTVLVDDSGRATKVIVPDAIPGDARDQIERLLLTLRYVPAECNGLHCSGTLQINL